MDFIICHGNINHFVPFWKYTRFLWYNEVLFSQNLRDSQSHVRRLEQWPKLGEAVLSENRKSISLKAGLLWKAAK